MKLLRLAVILFLVPAWGLQRARADSFPAPIVELRGTPVQMGTAYGKRFGTEIRLLDETYLKVYLGKPSERVAALLLAQGFHGRMLPEHRDECDALADAVGIARPEMSLFQCFLDLSDMTACSTITLPAGASPDHVARFRRDLDFPSFGVADKHSIVLVYHPDGRHAFAVVGWPGMIGVLSGMNDRGLCIANMEVTRPGGEPAVGMPYTLLYREILERCGTVDEGIALLKNSVRQSANNLMLMDAAGNRAVAEITRDGVVVRKAGELTALMCTNHQRGQDADTPGKCERYDYLHDQSAVEFGRIDVDSLHRMLEHVSQPGLTMQSMVFEPGNRVMYLAVGKDAASLPYARLDLKPYFTERTEFPAPRASRLDPK